MNIEHVSMESVDMRTVDMELAILIMFMCLFNNLNVIFESDFLKT